MEAAKTERTTAKRVFTRSKNRLIKIIEERSHVEIVEERFADLKKIWSDVQQKHELYIVANDGCDVEHEDLWITELDEAYGEVEKLKVDYVKRNEVKIDKTAEKDKEIKRALSLKIAEEEIFMNELSVIERLMHIENGRDVPVLKTVEKAYEELTVHFERCKSAYRTYSTLLGDEGILGDEMAWLKSKHGVCSDLRIKIGELSAVAEEKAAARTKMKHLKLEPMKMPKFDGNIRDYPRFKADFTKQVIPIIQSEDSQAYALKSCLTGIPLEVIRNVDDDLLEMWRRLDERYGKKSKLADIIMNDIKSFPFINESDDAQVIKFVDKVEGGHRDLLRVGMEREIGNTSAVSMIEEKLPRTIKREWSKRVNEKNSLVDESNKLPSLIDFLLEQKRIIEYETMDIRAGTSRPTVDAQGHHMLRENGNNIDEGRQGNNSSSDCWIHHTDNHQIGECRAYLDKTPEEKVQLLKERRACWSCLRVGHRSTNCQNRSVCIEENCDHFHHPSLHQAHVSGIFNFCSAATSKENSNQVSSKSCLLQIMSITSDKDPATDLNVLWDTGATLSLVTFEMARRLNLKGESIELSVVKVGGCKETIQSFKYDLPLRTCNGEVVYFKVYGIDKISTPVPQLDLKGIMTEFRNPCTSAFKRPYGNIDVLIGYEYAALHPVKEEAVENLLLLRNPFGTCLGGCHSLVREKTHKLIQHLTIMHVSKVNLDDFYKTETMGVECTPKCGNCRCGHCPIGSKDYTIQEERELRMMEQCLTYKGDNWECRYPYEKDPSLLPYNKHAVTAMLKSTEKRLSKNSEHADTYNKQIIDMVERGVARKLSNEEISSYKGPCYYISHHEILKPESASTPCRLVFNTSAKNSKGFSLNDCWVKGPDLLNNLLGILVRFREERVAVVGDIKKMYHAVKTPIAEQHVHRFLWRNMDTTREPDTYVITSLSFGDKPAGNLAILAVKLTAEMTKEDYPLAYETILNSLYVDDVVDCVNSIEEAHALIKEIETVMKRGGFEMKAWVISANVADSKDDVAAAALKAKDDNKDDIDDAIDSEKIINHGSSKVLGICWDPKADNFYFKVKLNFSPKKRKVYTEPDLTADQLDVNFPAMITRRMVLSQVNSIYDPLGLASPFTVKAKILMRKLCLNSSNQWDEPLPDEMRSEWKLFFQEMFEMEMITFPRCARPKGAKGDPILIVFSDGSEDAFGTCAYIRWELEDGGFKCILIAAKSRLAPLRKITIVRIELNGAVLSKRLMEFIVKESRLKFEKVYYFVDSMIVRAMIQLESYGFNTFVGVRLGELQNGTIPSDWYWIEGKLNIADCITRGKSPKDLDLGSEWQEGPAFLKQPESEWPIQSNCNIDPLPERSKWVLLGQMTEVDSLCVRINIQRHSCYKKLMRVTARVLSLYQRNPVPTLKNVLLTPSPSELEVAEKNWIVDAQKMLNMKQLERLGPRIREDGIIIVGSRIAKHVEISYDNQELVVLPHNHRLSRLYAEHIHNEGGHLGVSATVCKVRLRFWVLKLNKMVSSISNNCITCRKNRRLRNSQVMGQIPVERLKPAPAWHATSVDLFGPFQVRGETNKRSRGKCYGVLLNCLLTRAVHVDIATDYSTDSFLIVLRRFVSLRGFPGIIFSDQGSQLMGASKEMKSIINGIEKEKLREFGSEKGLEWKFSTPDAPWENGCAESLVKSVKKAIMICIGSQILSFSELLTVFYEAANLVNERPIGKLPSDPDEGSYLSPNHMLLGRASNRVPSGPFKNRSSIQHRHDFIQQLTDSFWRRWIAYYFPSLLIRQKWHCEKRNLALGDIVLIHDANIARGSWKLGKVCKVYVSEDDKVRRVDVQYKLFNSDEAAKDYTGKKYSVIQRSVHKLIVLLPIEEQQQPT